MKRRANETLLVNDMYFTVRLKLIIAEEENIPQLNMNSTELLTVH